MNSIRIERAENGFLVCMEDPAIVARNRKSDGPYMSPERQFVFDDEKGVVDFLSKNLDKLATNADDFDSSFDLAANEDEEDED